MAATRRQHKNQKESAWVPPLQRDPGPWNRLLLNWLATLAIIMVFGLVMLYSASYTTGYLRMGDSHSGFGEITVGKSPLTTSCSGTWIMFVNP